MEPPFPHFMFGMLSAIRDKSVKSYPVKKVRKTELSFPAGTLRMIHRFFF
jgi:hypothetical protein